MVGINSLLPVLRSYMVSQTVAKTRPKYQFNRILSSYFICFFKGGRTPPLASTGCRLIYLFLNFRLFLEKLHLRRLSNDPEVPVARKPGAGRDQPTHDDILLEPAKGINL